MFQLLGTEGTTREDIIRQGVSGKNAHIQWECGPELTDYLFNVTKKDQVDHVNTISKITVHIDKNCHIVVISLKIFLIDQICQ